MIIVAQFEPTINTPDFYERVNGREPPLVKTENDENPKYEIERLINKRLVKRKLQYLIEWKITEWNTIHGIISMISKIPKTRSMISKNLIDIFQPATQKTVKTDNIFSRFFITGTTTSNTFDNQATNR